MPRGSRTTDREEPEVKVDKKPESTVTAPVEVAAGPVSHTELDTDVAPAEDAVMDVAVQLAMQDGQRRPLSVIGGQPIWKGYEMLARAGLTAVLYLEKRRG